MNSRFRVAAAIGLSFLLSGCALAVVGGAATVGVGAAEERGFESTMEDTKIDADISQRWLQHSFSLFKDITLNIVEGRVMLTGSVEKSETRADAVRLAWQAPGVRQVLDEIQVTDQSGFRSYMQDSWIAEKLRERLRFDQHIKNINYKFDVENGVIYLIGIAQDQAEKDLVLAHARDINDVKRVVDHVQLKADRRRQGA